MSENLRVGYLRTMFLDIIRSEGMEINTHEGQVILAETLDIKFAELLQRRENTIRDDLSARLRIAEARIVELEGLLKEADELFNQTAELCDEPQTEEWLWKWKVKYYFHETETPVHPLPDDMKSEEV